MSLVELKSHIVKLLKESQNKELLEMLFEILKKKGTPSGDMWEDLTPNQKQELLDSYGESENEENLVEKNQLFRMLDF
ncbi:hypothetical protein [uncultured Algoriphagus sp.]|uniref:hypothetical protein n=1 Tax=uncultured Algoriphagus sp. TaxID=417365 RepID=UPI0030EE2372|tara:strand:- start:3722 stop:3955 length:234 start_codon:yes stop_codon:yes gene_type:complete